MSSETTSTSVNANSIGILQDQIRNLTESVERLSRLIPDLGRDSIGTLIPKLESELRDLNFQISPLETLPGEVKDLRASVQKLLDDDIKHELEILDFKDTERSILLEAIHRGSILLTGDTDRNKGLINELLDKVSRIQAEILPSKELDANGNRVASISSSIEGMKPALGRILMMLSEFSKLPATVHELFKGVRTEERAETARLQAAATVESIVPLQSKLDELNQNHALVSYQQELRIAALQEQIRELSQVIESQVDRKPAAAASKGFWSGKKSDQVNEESTGETESESLAITAPGHIARTFLEIQKFLTQMEGEVVNGKLLTFLKAIPDLFDRIERRLNLHNPAETSFDDFRTEFLDSIRGWQNNYWVQRFPEQDVTQIPVDFDERWHLSVGREIVQDSQLHGTLARVEKHGYRLINWMDETIPLRFAEVIVRLHVSPSVDKPV